MKASVAAPVTAPYGTWASALSAERVAAGVRPLAEPRFDGGRIGWLAGLPAEGGRVVICREGDAPGASGASGASGAFAQTLTPAPFNVRSRVHEYGGGAWLPLPGGRVFCHFADQRVYLQQDGAAAPRALTPADKLRHADFEHDAARRRLIAVCEDHGGGAALPANRLVAIGLEGDADARPRTLAEGFDFYAAPRLSPDGRQLAWLCWNLPSMPWYGCELWLAEIADDGGLVQPRRIAGGANESLCQPVWSPAGVLHVVSDRSGWWNLYRVQTGGAQPELQPLCPMNAEFGQPAWVFAQSSYGFTGEHQIVASVLREAVGGLLRIDVRDGRHQALDTGFTEIADLRTAPGQVLMLAASPTEAMQLMRVDPASGRCRVLARAIEPQDLPDAGLLPQPRTIRYPSAGGRIAHAFHYPPRNSGFVGPADERPPLIVTSHGGPTSCSGNGLRPGIAYWTSRGFAVLDVNYGGSTGFGRAYMEALDGQWGLVDVEDCVAGARFLAAQGDVDVQRMAIRGGSASGFTTLCALAFHRVFKAGASRYGVSDLASLDEDTHKFESQYTGRLIGPPAERERLYRERSPLHHAERIDCPVIFFQGLDDKVVPPAQSQRMVDALRARGIPVAYLAFEGEGHGFRRLETVRRTLEAELAFYARIFGFRIADAVEPVPLLGPLDPSSPAAAGG